MLTVEQHVDVARADGQQIHAGFPHERGGLIGIALLIAAAAFAPRSDIIVKSALRPYLFTVVHDVSFLIPEYVQERIL